MTNEEAIDLINCSAVDSCNLCAKNKKHGGDCEGATLVNEALNLAISALESIDRITAERDAAIADIKEAAHFPCKFCKKEEKGCNCWSAYDKWEWRGVQK